MPTRSALVSIALAAALACAPAEENGAAEPAEEAAAPGAQESLPPGADGAMARLESSPRHGEWVTVPSGAGDSVRAWVVYPERSDPAPVVLVVHEIFGLSNWIRSVADQLAADGFIAIAPDLLTGKGVPQEGGEPVGDAARAAIRDLDADEVHRRLSALAQWGMDLPAGTDSYGIVGFCWGGSTSFAHATRIPGLDASVVYYGGSPDEEALARVQTPVLGLYGGDDARVNSTIPRADSVLTALGRTYEPRIYEGAGHGFLRQQDGRDGANMEATRQAWPETVRWFRRYLEGS